MPGIAGAPETATGSTLPEREISLSGHPFTVEMAVTAPARSRGLMHRESLPPGRGMLFRFDSPGPVSFWMKNVRFPLDLLYFDSRGCLLAHHDSVPPCTTGRCPVYSSELATAWVLEVPAGTRQQLSIGEGDCALDMGR